MAFALFVNWTINGRSVLPLVPALAVLMTRHAAFARAPAWKRWLPLVPSAVLALLVTWGDHELAGMGRHAASELAPGPPRATVVTWFQGHWGFQYYMQQLGGRPWDVPHPEKANPGDRLIVPLNTSPRYRVPASLVETPRRYDFGPLPPTTTMNEGVGAGFYADRFGFLPFYFGPVPAESYDVYDVVGQGTLVPD